MYTCCTTVAHCCTLLNTVEHCCTLLYKIAEPRFASRLIVCDDLPLACERPRLVIIEHLGPSQLENGGSERKSKIAKLFSITRTTLKTYYWGPSDDFGATLTETAEHHIVSRLIVHDLPLACDRSRLVIIGHLGPSQLENGGSERKSKIVKLFSITRTTLKTYYWGPSGDFGATLP